MVAGLLEELTVKSRLFQMLDASGRARISSVAKEAWFSKDEIILREGEPGDAFYAIVSGTISVTADDFGHEKHIALLEAGAVFGEIAALTQEPRTATLTAATDVHALRFDMDRVLSVLEDYPAVLLELKRIGLTRSEALLEKMQEREGTSEEPASARE